MVFKTLPSVMKIGKTVDYFLCPKEHNVYQIYSFDTFNDSYNNAEVKSLILALSKIQTIKNQFGYFSGYSDTLYEICN